MEVIYTIIDFAHDIKGIFTATAAILGAIVFILKKIEKLKKEKGVKMEAKELFKKLIKAIGALNIVLLILGGGILLVNATTEPLPLNVRLTTAAWNAFNKGEYREAIKKVEECIDNFEPSALREQRELERSNTQLPPIGMVSDDAKKMIFKRGLLNDVATCWFIKGRSLEKLGRKQEAIQAYRRAEVYTYARTYDPGWNGFWSPSQGAIDRRTFLEGNQ